MNNSALISQNARKIKDKDNLRGVPNIKRLSYVKSLKLRGEGRDMMDMILPRH